MIKEKFKVEVRRFTRKEQNEHIYRILRDHPEGLTYTELAYVSGTSKNCKYVKKVLNRLKNKVFIRKVGYIKIVYSSIHARKLRKMEEKYV